MRRVVLALLVAALPMWPVSAGASPADGSLDRLVALVVERLDTADAVAAAKWAAAGEHGVQPAIDDPAREAEVYDAMARLGNSRDLPENWVRQVFLGQIEAHKTVQRGLMLRWRFDPAAAPEATAGLASVRPAIDRVNVEILDQLATRRAQLTAPDCAERLARSVFGVFTTGGGDPLHRAALVRAAASLCPA
ncbi:gamma subclass chorismate mutase AroQ [Nocardia abscessus]|uniref:gamma subclass chorismate mutase AroQ n=1 Tax=Nocardia TaxID=1817 RepID=UPI00189303D8|nr:MULTISPECIES: gamma subclass chorismate mutase AroQ [Nocardia]MBF6220961.1 gamma subclass chorismate mutase AroQ [Nocardia abscessus]MDE1668730.1 gamma subclass chorismate mutase AroQ [Nocardia gipuzkoensis]